LDWLKESEENTIAFLNIKKIYNLKKIRHYSSEPVLNNALQKFEQRLESTLPAAKHNFIWTYSKYAAVLVATVSVALLFWLNVKETPVELTSVNLGNNDPVKMIILSDGTKVWVNSGSTFTYPISFQRNEREVSIEGEAYFEVKRDVNHPFTVATKSMSVRVLGTSFDVNTKTSDHSIQTTLVTGKVSIQDKNGKEMAKLFPGQMAKYNSNHSLSINTVDTEIYTGWRNGLIIFQKATLAEITQKIEQFYNVKITVNSRKPIQNRYNFVFRRTHSLDTVLEMLKFVAPVTYKKHDKQVYINSK
jgi:ferric-dicitrate binding protein FerR (iron transport regulator)